MGDDNKTFFDFFYLWLNDKMREENIGEEDVIIKFLDTTDESEFPFLKVDIYLGYSGFGHENLTCWAKRRDPMAEEPSVRTDDDWIRLGAGTSS